MAQATRQSIDAPRARTSFGRYRVMAFVTGAMLLLLVVEMTLKYVFQANGVDPETGNARAVLGSWIAIVHGWIYVVYAVAVFDVWSRMRWSLQRLFVMIAGGVVPVLSFIVERKAHGWLEADLEASGAPASGSSGR